MKLIIFYNISYANSTRLREEENENQKISSGEIYINQDGKLVNIDEIGTNNMESKQRKVFYEEQNMGPYKVMISLE